MRVDTIYIQRHLQVDTGRAKRLAALVRRHEAAEASGEETPADPEDTADDGAILEALRAARRSH